MKKLILSLTIISALGTIIVNAEEEKFKDHSRACYSVLNVDSVERKKLELMLKTNLSDKLIEEQKEKYILTLVNQQIICNKDGKEYLQMDNEEKIMFFNEVTIEELKKLFMRDGTKEELKKLGETIKARAKR